MLYNKHKKLQDEFFLILNSSGNSKGKVLKIFDKIDSLPSRKERFVAMTMLMLVIHMMGEADSISAAQDDLLTHLAAAKDGGDDGNSGGNGELN